ncbi:hypothetical protein Bhyg_10482 [Pseudolycoriella hygida]|uniref:Uncharacterized protein n=1 Tax=Pseudolycoriella hygida TaxID=35572 RepID=A0A9Q0MTJ8_9DIPT|nr:hypothetical protein Bhyg_10482 [Pseudolycoriella hygida]
MYNAWFCPFSQKLFTVITLFHELEFLFPVLSPDPNIVVTVYSLSRKSIWRSNNSLHFTLVCFLQIVQKINNFFFANSNLSITEMQAAKNNKQPIKIVCPINSKYLAEGVYLYFEFNEYGIQLRDVVGWGTTKPSTKCQISNSIFHHVILTNDIHVLDAKKVSKRLFKPLFDMFKIKTQKRNYLQIEVAFLVDLFVGFMGKKGKKGTHLIFLNLNNFNLIYINEVTKDINSGSGVDMNPCLDLKRTFFCISNTSLRATSHHLTSALTRKMTKNIQSAKCKPTFSYNTFYTNFPRVLNVYNRCEGYLIIIKRSLALCRVKEPKIRENPDKSHEHKIASKMNKMNSFRKEAKFNLDFVVSEFIGNFRIVGTHFSLSATIMHDDERDLVGQLIAHWAHQLQVAYGLWFSELPNA